MAIYPLVQLPLEDYELMKRYFDFLMVWKPQLEKYYNDSIIMEKFFAELKAL